MAKPKLVTPGVLVDESLAYLQAKEDSSGQLGRTAAFWNGFEGWLKFELGAMLAESRRYEPWTEDEKPGDVGLEYRAKLKGGGKKLVDMWVSPEKGSAAWNFVELKVVFQNPNANKQVRSWRSDFDKLQLIDRRGRLQKVAGTLSLVFGVGFEEADFCARTDAKAKTLPAGAVCSEVLRIDLKDGAKAVFVRALSKG